MTRRQLLQLSGATVGAAALIGARSAAAAGPVDFSQRSAYDAAYQDFYSSPGGVPEVNNEAGGLAWGKSYSLLSTLRMYEAYRDLTYLDHFVADADAVLAQRDSVRGVTDYRGLSLPAWRAGDRYTSGIVRIPDADGRPTLEIRSALGSSGSSTAAVTHNSDGTFSVTVVNPVNNVTRAFTGLTMDPASSRYAVSQIYDAYDGTARITAADLRPQPGAAGEPATGTYDFAGQYVIFAVHTGMISYPIAYFARLALTDSRLRARYGSSAKQYLADVEAAVAVHDREWYERVENGKQLGSYVWVKGMALPFDGCEQPVNQSCGLGQAVSQLALATRDPRYIRKSILLSTWLAGQLVTDPTGSDIWSYWPSSSQVYGGFGRTGSPATDISLFTPEYPNGNPGIDDVSHGAIIVECAAQLESGHLGSIRPLDLDRIATTYSRHLAQTGSDGLPTTATRLDGSGTATSGYYLQAPRWMPLASRNREIFTQSLSIYNDRQPEISSGSLLLGVGYFNWYART
ncbi:MAG TPA: hypothetical protein VHC49_21155 [Mycobacteriales bacterium]|nr:hypothetical protein [Mycobacteriales bacterium]